MLFFFERKMNLVTEAVPIFFKKKKHDGAPTSCFQGMTVFAVHGGRQACKDARSSKHESHVLIAWSVFPALRPCSGKRAVPKTCSRLCATLWEFLLRRLMGAEPYNAGLGSVPCAL